MKDGFIQQIGAPQKLFDDPVNTFVAGFIGTPQMNFFDGHISPNGVLTFANDQKIKLNKEQFARYDTEKIGDGLDIILGIRPGNLKLTTKPAPNAGVSCKVNVMEALGDETIIYADLDKSSNGSIDGSKTIITASVKGGASCVGGEEVYLDLDLDKLHLFDKQTERTLRLQDDLYK